jgi:GH24 family phage-related lysozyme (muramidase)
MTNPANDTLRTSMEGIELIKEFEGCAEKRDDGKYEPYYDAVGVLTIGYGHTNSAESHPFDEETIWTFGKCEVALVDDLKEFEGYVKNLVTIKTMQCQFDALVSFTYNCGPGNLEKSTLLKKHNAGDFHGAEAEFAKWNKAGGQELEGLTRRRAAEAELYGQWDEELLEEVEDRVKT